MYRNKLKRMIQDLENITFVEKKKSMMSFSLRKEKREREGMEEAIVKHAQTAARIICSACPYG